jgi:hypothetical protein
VTEDPLVKWFEAGLHATCVSLYVTTAFERAHQRIDSRIASACRRYKGRVSLWAQPCEPVDMVEHMKPCADMPAIQDRMTTT